MKIELDLPEIEGFEYTGEYRHPAKGDYVNFPDGRTQKIDHSFSETKHPILKKKAPVYKTTTVDTGRELFKYVEIKALEDALGVIDSGEWGAEEERTLAALEELIK